MIKTKNSSKKGKIPQIITLGCRLNSYESSNIDEILKSNNIDDIVIINTCAVTKEAERKSRQAVKRAKKDNPDKKIIVTGCAAQINPEQFIKMEEVARVIGNDIKNNKETYINILDINTEKALINDIMSIKETAPQFIIGKQDRSRAFLQIQNGCNHRCTFCIIPYGRGNSRSVPVAQIITHIKELVANRYNEIVLTGVDITEYGLDLPGSPKLGNLCKRILENTNLPRLRLSSVDVAEIDDDILDLIKNEPRFMPYFHISLQSGDDMILKRMKRRHTRDDVFKFCEFVRKYRNDAGFGADIICGFPTETDEMFQNTLKLVSEARIPFVHAFTYSARSGTPAAKMPQIPLQKRKARTNELIALGEKVKNEFYQTLVGKTQKIVLEEGFVGHAENFAKISIEPNNNLKIGSIIEVLCKNVDRDNIVAETI